MKVLKAKQVAEEINVSVPQVYKLVSIGRFPKPIKLGERGSGWLTTEIDAWLQSRVDEEMRRLPMAKVIDAKFSIKSDKYNWILIEKSKGKKVKHHFFPTVKQLSNFVGEYRLRKCLVEGEVDLLDKSSQTPSYSPVIEQSVLKLEQYIESIVRDENDKT